MVKFFGKMRQNLLSEGRIFNYLKYAFGEIVLVVIGILIALQINNWNESQKERVFELKTLESIQNALKSDRDYYSNHLLQYRNKETIKAVQYFHDLIKGTDRPLDSISYYFEWLTKGLTFQVNAGPYESLKAIGVDKISDNALRSEIVFYYDFAAPRQNDLIKWGQYNVENEHKRASALLGPYHSEVKNGDVVISRPTPDPSITANPDFLEILEDADERSQFIKGRLNKLLSFLNPLVDHIDTVLKDNAGNKN